MKWRRKPIVRDVVDAIKTAASYVYVNGKGDTIEVPAADFERDYDPVLKDRKPKAVGTKRKRRGNGVQPGAAAQ